MIVVQLIFVPVFEDENGDKDIAYVEYNNPNVQFQTDETRIMFDNGLS